MSKIVKIVRIFLGIFIIYSFNNCCDKVIYFSTETNLCWEDFKGTIDTTSKFSAISATSIKYKSKFNDTGLFTYTVTSIFDCSQSWVKPKSQNDHLLKHEQLHFLIAEKNARILRRNFENYKKVFNYKTVSKDLNELYKEVLELEDKEQDLYDKETNHSLDLCGQECWEAKIKKELMELDNWK